MDQITKGKIIDKLFFCMSVERLFQNFALKIHIKLRPTVKIKLALTRQNIKGRSCKPIKKFHLTKWEQIASHLFNTDFTLRAKCNIWLKNLILSDNEKIFFLFKSLCFRGIHKPRGQFGRGYQITTLFYKCPRRGIGMDQNTQESVHVVYGWLLIPIDFISRNNIVKLYQTIKFSIVIWFLF